MTRRRRYHIEWDRMSHEWIVWEHPDGDTLGTYPTLLEAEQAITDINATPTKGARR